MLHSDVKYRSCLTYRAVVYLVLFGLLCIIIACCFPISSSFLVLLVLVVRVFAFWFWPFASFCWFLINCKWILCLWWIITKFFTSNGSSRSPGCGNVPRGYVCAYQEHFAALQAANEHLLSWFLIRCLTQILLLQFLVFTCSLSPYLTCLITLPLPDDFHLCINSPI